ncbi:unnamed protein product [Symbiodinium natans]|uniref:Uncharacterized protein n=1 Tax=Symbiodinium natans TaxID=878477 RepID=A0A812VH01_9DINO|nr:unnamed protein product [Symbiodinium natans]
MLNHILLLHQSTQLQQLRQVQTEQDRHLRELQQLQSAPGPCIPRTRRASPPRRSERAQTAQTAQAQIQERGLPRADQERLSGSQALPTLPTSPSAADQVPPVESWRRHEQQPPPEYEASDASVSEASASLSSVVPSSRGSLRLQRDRAALQRRLTELGDG